MPSVKYTDYVVAPGFATEDGKSAALGEFASKLLHQLPDWRVLFQADGQATLGNATALAANTVLLVPFVLDHKQQLTRLGMFLPNGAGSGNFVFGIYAMDLVAMMPTNLLYNSPAFPATNGGFQAEAVPTTELVLDKGLYFAAFASSVSVTFRGVPQANMRVIRGYTDLTKTTIRSRYTLPLAYTAALPAVFPTAGIVQAEGAGFNAPALFYKSTPV
jgi:hypothetical protein